MHVGIHLTKLVFHIHEACTTILIKDIACMEIIAPQNENIVN